jgi:hypothetical protein
MTGYAPVPLNVSLGEKHSRYFGNEYTEFDWAVSGKSALWKTSVGSGRFQVRNFLLLGGFR